MSDDAPDEVAVLLDDGLTLDVVRAREADELIGVAVASDARRIRNDEEQDERDEADQERQDERPDDALENKGSQDLRLSA